MRKKSPVRRQAILDAAKITFEKWGFEQATMADIATLAGVSKATLYSYFSAKNELFVELIEASADQHLDQMHSIYVGEQTSFDPDEIRSTIALLQPTKDVASTLKQLGERILGTFFTPQRLALKRMIIAESGKGQIGRLYYERGPGLGMKYLEQYFGEVIAAGHLRPADPKLVAAHFHGLLESEIFEPWLLNILRELTPDLIESVVERAVEVFMRAYGPERDQNS